MNKMWRVPVNQTVTAAGTDTELLYITPADDKPIKLWGWIMGQTSEVGDALERGWRLTNRVLTATVTVGSGGSAVTPANPRLTVAAAFTARTNDTTVATSSGTNTVIEEIPFNIRNTPWERWIPEEYRFWVLQTEAQVIRLETTPATSVTFNATFFVEEIS